jgi:hypothetical protein
VQLRSAREYYGIEDKHRCKEAGDLVVSRAVSKLKGDMLLVEMAMKEVRNRVLCLLLRVFHVSQGIKHLPSLLYRLAFRVLWARSCMIVSVFIQYLQHEYLSKQQAVRFLL